MAKCNICDKKIGFLAQEFWDDEGKRLCEECSDKLELEKEQIRQQQEKRAKDRSEAISKVMLTTGGIQHPYEILDVIIAIEGHEAGYFDSANPAKAFDGVKKQLRTIAYDMKADVVVHCQFEYRVAAERGLFGSKQAIEIFAYGTAVKLKKNAL